MNSASTTMKKSLSSSFLASIIIALLLPNGNRSQEVCLFCPAGTEVTIPDFPLPLTNHEITCLEAQELAMSGTVDDDICAQAIAFQSIIVQLCGCEPITSNPTQAPTSSPATEPPSQNPTLPASQCEFCPLGTETTSDLKIPTVEGSISCLEGQELAKSGNLDDASCAQLVQVHFLIQLFCDCQPVPITAAPESTAVGQPTDAPATRAPSPNPAPEACDFCPAGTEVSIDYAHPVAGQTISCLSMQRAALNGELDSDTCAKILAFQGFIAQYCGCQPENSSSTIPPTPAPVAATPEPTTPEPTPATVAKAASSGQACNFCPPGMEVTIPNFQLPLPNHNITCLEAQDLAQSGTLGDDICAQALTYQSFIVDLCGCEPISSMTSAPTPAATSPCEFCPPGMETTNDLRIPTIEGSISCLQGQEKAQNGDLDEESCAQILEIQFLIEIYCDCQPIASTPASAPAVTEVVPPPEPTAPSPTPAPEVCDFCPAGTEVTIDFSHTIAGQTVSCLSMQRAARRGELHADVCAEILTFQGLIAQFCGCETLSDIPSTSAPTGAAAAQSQAPVGAACEFCPPGTEVTIPNYQLPLPNHEITCLEAQTLAQGGTLDPDVCAQALTFQTFIIELCGCKEPITAAADTTTPAPTNNPTSSPTTAPSTTCEFCGTGMETTSDLRIPTVEGSISCLEAQELAQNGSLDEEACARLDEIQFIIDLYCDCQPINSKPAKKNSKAPHEVCPFCPLGTEVTIDFTHPVAGQTISCLSMENAALSGELTADTCEEILAFQGVISEFCGCEPIASTPSETSESTRKKGMKL